MVRVEVIHTEMVKPSSPTPDHLRRLDLSFLDQVSPPVFMPFVLFFPKEGLHSDEEKAHRIKESLSEALTSYYPLAGRVKDNLYVDCNDEGVLYVEARVKCQLSDILRDPVPKMLNEFLPVELDDVEELPVAVQVNIFDCGGLAISLCMSHKVADALSFFNFLNSWAATSRLRVSSDPTPSPCFAASTLFPPVDLTGLRFSNGIVKEGISTKRYVFNAATIAALRVRFTDNNSQARRPTRVEALSSFLWTRYMAATGKSVGDPDALYTILHAVNLRTRMDPPLSERNFGNISRFALTFPSREAAKEGGHMLVDEVREAIKKVNPDYARTLQDPERHGHLRFMKERSSGISKGEVVSFSFTSLCRFPMYEADFGWGKPAWAGSASLKFKNLIVFLDTRSGDGIEAWVNLKEEDMEKFDMDKELLAHASADVGVGIKGGSFSLGGWGGGGHLSIQVGLVVLCFSCV